MTGSNQEINPGVCGSGLWIDKSIHTHIHTPFIVVSPWRLSDRIPPQLVKENRVPHFHRLLQCVACEREREKETVGVCMSVCQNCEMHYLPAWAR